MKEIDLISFISLEFQKRKKERKNYSLRSFAKDLDIQPATLSHILNRKRKISKTNRDKIYKSLNITNEQKEEFEKSKDQSPKHFSDIDLKQFETFADWYFDAILELTRLKGFESNESYIASKLGLKETLVEELIEKLFKSNLLGKTPNGKWVDKSGDNLAYGGEETTYFLQNLQIQLLQKAIESIKEVPKKEREQSSMMLAINKKDLPEVRRKIKAFHQEICQYTQRPGREADEVYQLLTSFYPLTKN